MTFFSFWVIGKNGRVSIFKQIYCISMEPFNSNRNLIHCLLVRVLEPSFPLLATLSLHKLLLDMDFDLDLECIQCQLCVKIRITYFIIYEMLVWKYDWITNGWKIIHTDIHILINIEHIFRVDHHCPNLERSPNEWSYAIQLFVALCIPRNKTRLICPVFDHSLLMPFERPFDVLYRRL